MYMVNEEECTACGVCMEYCMENAISITGRSAVIDRTRCTSCGDCRDACPQGAILEVAEVTPYRGSTDVVPATAGRKVPATVTARPLRLTRQEKTAAFTAILPVVTRILVRMADKFLSRSDRGLPARDARGTGGDGSSVRGGRGRHRWRGGS